MNGRLLGTIVVMIAVACRAPESDIPIPPPGSDRPVIAAPVPTQPTPKRRRDRNASAGASNNYAIPAAAGPTASGNPNAAQSPASTSAPLAEKPRDLPEELRGALGNPSACFSKRTAGNGPPVLHFDVTAAVTPTGIVNRARVTGGGLSLEETACLEALVVSARFKGPVDGAPLNVQAAIELREQPKPPPAPASH